MGVKRQHEDFIEVVIETTDPHGKGDDVEEFMDNGGDVIDNASLLVGINLDRDCCRGVNPEPVAEALLGSHPPEGHFHFRMG